MSIFASQTERTAIRQRLVDSLVDESNTQEQSESLLLVSKLLDHPLKLFQFENRVSRLMLADPQLQAAIAPSPYPILEQLIKWLEDNWLTILTTILKLFIH